MESAAIFFGLGAAALWGAGDFAGGLASKRAPLLGVVVPSQLIGLALVVAFALISGEPMPSTTVLTWGALAGIAGGVGVASLYRALAVGRMGIVAPVSGVGAAGIPVLVGVAVGERPQVLQIVGVGCALAAVALVSRPERGKPDQGLALAGVAALGFGLFFVLLDRAGADATFWPLVAARLGSVSCLGFGGLALGRSLIPPRAALGLVVVSGLLDMAANGLYVLGTQYGLLSLVAVLASLYPVGTVMLARLVIAERLVAIQQAGVLLAVAGAALIAAG